MLIHWIDLQPIRATELNATVNRTIDIYKTELNTVYRLHSNHSLHNAFVLTSDF